MFTPLIRAITRSALPLLLPRIRADHKHPPVPADDLALLAHRFDRGSYLHVTRFALVVSFGGSHSPGSGSRCGLRYRHWGAPHAAQNSRATGAPADTSRGGRSRTGRPRRSLPLDIG